MAITRAKIKTHKDTSINASKKARKPAMTTDEFIAKADKEPLRPEPSVSIENRPYGVRKHRAELIIKHHAPWAAAAGSVPLPGVDFAGIFAIQMRMLAKIGDIYGVAFKEDAAKNAIASLMAGILQSTFAFGMVSSLKFIPIIGTLIGLIALPTLAAAGTYAVGKVFVMHFEAGGTFFDLDPDKMHAHFKTEFQTKRRDPDILNDR